MVLGIVLTGEEVQLIRTALCLGVARFAADSSDFNGARAQEVIEQWRMFDEVSSKLVNAF